MFYGSLLNYYATIIYCVNKVNQSQLAYLSFIGSIVFFFSTAELQSASILYVDKMLNAKSSHWTNE